MEQQEISRPEALFSDLKNTADRVSPGGFLRGMVRRAAPIAIGTALSQFVILAASPLLTRLYSPGDFGVLGVYSAAISMISVMACLRYELAIPLPDNDDAAAALVVLSLVVCLAIASITGAALAEFGDFITRWTNSEALSPYLWLLPIGILILGTYQSLSYWAVRKRKFRALGRTKIAQGVGLVAVQLGAGALAIGPLGLLVGDVVGRGSGVASLAGSAVRDGILKFRKGLRTRIPKLAGQYRNFPLISSFSGFFNTGAQQLPALLLAVFYGTHAVGWFVLIQRVFGGASLLVSQSVTQVYVGTAAPLVHSDPISLRQLFLSTVRHLSLWISLPAALLMLSAPEPFKWIFGQQWMMAGHILQALAPMYAAELVISPVSQTLFLLQRQDIQLYWDAARFAFAVVAIYAAGMAGLSVVAAMAVYGAVMLVMSGANFLLILHQIAVRTTSISSVGA